MSYDYSGKTVVVTGGARGLGLEFARELSRRGASLIVTARNAQALNEATKALPAGAKVVAAVVADLAAPRGADDLILALEALDRPIDVLINNAGSALGGTYLDSPWNEVESMLTLNALSLARLTYWAAAKMKRRGEGRILNVSAVTASQPVPYFAAYSATRAFVTSLSIALNKELKGSGVVVSALHPPATATGFADHAEIRSTLALRLFGFMKPQTVARAGLDGLAAGQFRIVPGLLAKAIWFSNNVTPSTAGLAVMGLLFKRRGTAVSVAAIAALQR